MNNVTNLNQLESDESDLNFSVDSLEENLHDVDKKNLKKNITKQKTELSENVKINKVQENKNDLKLTVNEISDSNIIIPFYSQELTLAEIRKLQRSARKKIKHPIKLNKNHTYYNNNNTNSIMSSQNDLHLPLDDLTIYTDFSFAETELTKKCSSSDDLNKSKRTSRSPTLDNKTMTERTRGKSLSYLEQYRKKTEIKLKKQIKDESACSTIGTSTSSCRTQLSLTDLPDTYSASRNDFHTESEIRFYEDIIHNKNFSHSSPRNDPGQPNSKRNTNDGDLTQREQMLQNKLTEENKKIKKMLQEKEKDKPNTSSQKKRSPRKEFAVNLGTLGPDIEKTKEKMETFMKRKEYGNTVSCKNRLDILQKRECYSLKPLEETKSFIPVPITTYSLVINDERNQLNLRISTKNQNKMKKESKERINTVKKKKKDKVENEEKHADYKKSNTQDSFTMNEDKTMMMLQRHELEKKIAENIRNQFSND